MRQHIIDVKEDAELWQKHLPHLEPFVGANPDENSLQQPPNAWVREMQRRRGDRLEKKQAIRAEVRAIVADKNAAQPEFRSPDPQGPGRRDYGNE